MQISVEALIVALRGAADALETEYLQAASVPEPVAETKKTQSVVFAEPAGEPTPVAQVTPPQEDAAPWETEEPAPPPAAAQPVVTPDDIKLLYQQLAQQGTKIDMLGMLSSLGVQKVGELGGEGRASLYAMMQKAANMG
jgi:hypothetical protein